MSLRQSRRHQSCPCLLRVVVSIRGLLWQSSSVAAVQSSPVRENSNMLSSKPRWKSPNAQDSVLETPISQIYKELQAGSPIKAFLSQTAVILSVDAVQSHLLNSACFGRPILAGNKAFLSSGGDALIESPLDHDNVLKDGEEMFLYELSFEEAFFLVHELKCLWVSQKLSQGISSPFLSHYLITKPYSSHGHVAHMIYLSYKTQGDVPLSEDGLWKLVLKRNPGFLHYYKAYSHLRSKNWIVRTGLQYGAHFVAYRHHPAYVHAEYSVIVVPEWEKQMQLSSWSHLQGIVRLCGSVAKTLLLLHVKSARLENYHPNCLEFYSVEEMEVIRWLPKKHRMDDCPSSGPSQEDT